MHSTRLSRAVCATALGLVAGLAVATPGWANADIGINSGNVPTTAAEAEQECSDDLGGGPFPGRDVWVFNLPGNHDRTGDFVSIRAEFDTDGDGTGDKTVTIEDGAGDGDDIVTVGHSKAWVVTPAGWTLVDATATITGTAKKFVLTHACAGDGGKTPTPPTDESPSPKPSKSDGAGGGGGAGGGLPVTGTPVGAIAVVGTALVAAGAAMLLANRRRREPGAADV